MTISVVYVSKLIINAITAITPRYRNHTSQEPMSGSMQLTYILVTAFSHTDLFLDRISRE